MVKDVLFDIVAKTMEVLVFPTLAQCVACIASFDLWMSCASYDIFAMVVNFIDDAWHPTHITIGLFEVQNISNAYMEKQMKGYWGLLVYWTRLLHTSMPTKALTLHPLPLF
jgi:hypothetical protein